MRHLVPESAERSSARASASSRDDRCGSGADQRAPNGESVDVEGWLVEQLLSFVEDDIEGTCRELNLMRRVSTRTSV